MTLSNFIELIVLNNILFKIPPQKKTWTLCCTVHQTQKVGNYCSSVSKSPVLLIELVLGLAQKVKCLIPIGICALKLCIFENYGGSKYESIHLFAYIQQPVLLIYKASTDPRGSNSSG